MSSDSRHHPPASRRATGRPGDYVATVNATFGGETISAPDGASVAAALMNSGHTSWRTTREGRPRGLFCGIGICFDCIVDIDGESGQRACMVPLQEGMDVRPARSTFADTEEHPR